MLLGGHLISGRSSLVHQRASQFRVVAETFLVILTLALVTSFAGVAAAAGLLVPLHVLAARRYGVAGRLAWGVLAGISLGITAAILINGAAWFAFIAGLMLGVGMVVVGARR